MAQVYEALPGGDGGAWSGTLADVPTILANRPAAQNGAAPLRMPVKTKEIELDGEWAGWHLTVRRNAPIDVVIRLEDLQMDARSLGALMDLLPEVIIRWNFADEAGEPLPISAAGMRRLPMELFQAVMEAFGALVNEQVTVPKE